jgi:hypothetical protein
MLIDVWTGLKLYEHRGKSLGKAVGKLRIGWYVEDTYITNGDTLADEVEVPYTCFVRRATQSLRGRPC